MKTINIKIANANITIAIEDEIAPLIREYVFKYHSRYTNKKDEPKYIIQKECDKYVITKNNRVVNRNRKISNIVYDIETKIINEFLTKNKDKLIIHSACLIKDGKAHLFAGPAKSGKTTLSIFLANHDYLFAGDEFVMIDLKKKRIYPVVRNIILKPRINNDIIEMFNLPDDKLLKVSGSIYLDPSYFGKIAKIKFYPIEKIFFIDTFYETRTKKPGAVDIFNNFIEVVYNPYNIRRRLLESINDLLTLAEYRLMKFKHPFFLNDEEKATLFKNLE